MTFKKIESAYKLAIIGAILAIATACFDPGADIDRVQANYQNKSLFNGEWYQRASVVDKQFNNSNAFVGWECDLDRVKFEITEKHLLAYRSYAKVPGAEASDAGSKTLVASFPIESHFDIAREYNALNGVENNVIVENATDKPWWEREFIRVDWSNNTAPEFRCNAFLKGMSASQVSRNSGELPQEEWRVRVSQDYVETTIDAITKPEGYACRATGDWNCEGSNVKMKFSFKRIKEAEHKVYEKKEYPDFLPMKFGADKDGKPCIEGERGCKKTEEVWLYDTPFGREICDPNKHDATECSLSTVPVFSRFGYFRTERQHYDRENGFTLSGREQLINRWNIWEASKDQNGVEIALENRVPKKIVYHLNVDFPEDLHEAVRSIENQWDIAFRDTVAQLRNQCSIDGVNKFVKKNRLAQLMADNNLATVTEANVKQVCQILTENASRNPEAPEFFNGTQEQIETKFGKLFEVKVNSCNVDNAQNYMINNNLESELSSLGLSHIDTENLTEACAALEFYSQESNLEEPFHWEQLGDLRYSFVNYTKKAELSGPLGYGPSAADPLTGEIISGNANVYGKSIDLYANKAADIVQSLNGKLSRESILNGSHIRENFQTKSGIRNFEQVLDARTQHMSDDTYATRLPIASIGENWRALANSGFEDEYLIDDEMINMFAGLEMAKPSIWSLPLMPSTQSYFKREMANLAVDSQGNFAESAVNDFQKREEFFSKNSACFLTGSVEPAVAELAKSMVGLSREEVYKKVRASVFTAVMLHELGHTFGLRHNFEGSADPLNFFPNFWDVDTHDHRTTKETQNKTEMRYSSIMDYHQRFNSDFAGIGLYDKAAIKFGYGDLVEVFDETEEEYLPHGWMNYLNLLGYKDLPKIFSGAGAGDKMESHYSDVIRRYNNGDVSAHMDIGSLDLDSKPENLYKRKYISFSRFYREKGLELFGQKNEDGGNLYEVPYKYCSDSYAWGGSLTCNRWDMGANSEEIVKNAAEMYDSYYFFNNFKRDRINFGTRTYYGGLYSRTYQPMLNAFKYMYYYRRSSARIWPMLRDWTTAAEYGLNFFGRVLQTVEPGEYCLDESKNTYVLDKDGSCDKNNFVVPPGVGKYYNSTWNTDFFAKQRSIGHRYDKILAMQALTDNAAFFTRDFSSMVSRGAFSIGYYRVFAPEMVKLFTGIMMGDTSVFSPKVVEIDGKKTIEYQPLVDLLSEVPGSHAALPSIKPTTSSLMKYYGAVLPMIYFSSTVDSQLDYAKRSKISIVGSKNDPTVTGEFSQVVYTDPITHLSYKATAFGDPQLSPSYQLLKSASDFLGSFESSAEEQKGTWSGAQKALGSAKKSLKKAKAENLPAEEISKREVLVKEAEREARHKNEELTRRTQTIDMVRSISDMMTYGG